MLLSLYLQMLTPVVDDASFEFPIMAMALSGDVSEKILSQTAFVKR